MFNLILNINKSVTSTYLQRRYITLRVASLEVWFLVGLGVKILSLSKTCENYARSSKFGLYVHTNIKFWKMYIIVISIFWQK